MFDVCRVERQIGGRLLSIETGKIAKQADGAVVVQCGDTVVLVASVTAPPRTEEVDFFPLSVEYREKHSAAGKFPGGFIKREGRPSTKEVLTARMIDRPIRPLFPAGYFEEGDLNLLLGGTKEALNMIEVETKELSEQVISDAVALAQQTVVTVCEMI